jgi:ubiquinone/menaquinone biosynthesis C-methylase UbiE
MSQFHQSYFLSTCAHYNESIQLIERLNLLGDERVLDIGCGDGRITAHIAELLSKGLIVGLDRDKIFIELARQEFPSNNYPNIKFVYADALEMPYEEEFNLIVSFSVIHYVSNQNLFFEKVKRALKTKGRIAFGFGIYNEDNCSFRSTLMALMKNQKWEPFFQSIKLEYRKDTLENYMKLLSEEHGFETQYIDFKDVAYPFPNQSELRKCIESNWISLTNLLKNS